MIRFETNVRIAQWTGAFEAIFLNSSMWSNRSGQGVVINSIDDGKHGTDTLHGLSLAVDLDTEGDDPKDLESLFQYLRRTMPAQYDVIFEGDHVHVEWDVKRNESRIPKK